MILMEPINLVTGLPGAGKTLFGIDLLRKCKAEGLTCYNYNVNGLDPELAEPWSGPIENWTDLPEKSALIVDEAHGVFPVRPVNAKVPDHIQALAEIRHKGIRLILIDQDPSTLDRFVKRRVGSHFHLVNRTGFDAARVFSNRGCVDNPRAAGAWSVGESDTWRYPKELFDRYKSASIHIKKKRIPRMIYVLVIAVVLVIAGFGWAFSSFTFGIDDDPPQEAAAEQPIDGQGVFASAGSDLAAGLFGTSNQRPAFRTPDEWLAAHLPLVDAIPWSAPIFASRTPTTNPDLLCVVIGEVDSWQAQCRCYTEQVTPLDIDRAVCLKAARHGVYNPYRTTHNAPQGVSSDGTMHGASARAVAEANPARADAPASPPTSASPKRAPGPSYAAPPPVPPFEGVY